MGTEYTIKNAHYAHQASLFMKEAVFPVQLVQS